MPPKHGWESDEKAAADAQPADDHASHAWEGDSGEDAAGSTSGDSEESDADEPSPGELFVGHMTGLYLTRALSARDFCIAMKHAGDAGIEAAKPYGLDPASQSGKFQRHLAKVMPFMREDHGLYHFCLPSFNKEDLGSGEHAFCALTPHEVAHKMMAEDPSALLRLQEAIEARDLPQSYFDHPLVRDKAEDEDILPVSLFVDGVPYSKVDSLVGFWLCNEITGQRVLLAALRKNLQCSCGCRGWCSYWAIFDFLAWSFKAMAAGAFPSARHDCSDFLSSEQRRANLAGTPLVRKCCLLYIKGDWAEYSGTFGLPSAADGARPCYACNCSASTMYESEGISPVDMPWRLNAAADYFSACSRSEHLVVLSPASHAKLLDLLESDKRLAGNHGRCLTADFAELNLRSGDRLEPSVFLRDPSKLEDISSFPAPVMFWRVSEETSARHRNPLFDDTLGTSPAATLTVDVLHTIHLGVMHSFSRYLVHWMLSNGMWGRHPTAEETIEAGSVVLKVELKVFYRQRHRQYPAENLTRVSFSRKVIGDRAGNNVLRTKGAQTWGFFLFLLCRLEANVQRLGPEAAILLEAGKALREIVLIWDRSPQNVPPADIQSCFNNWSRHLRLTTGIEEIEIPKRHLVAHLLFRIRLQGNPRRYAVWVDESLNKTLKAACRTVSQTNFESSLILRMRELIRHGHKRRAA